MKKKYFLLGNLIGLAILAGFVFFTKPALLCACKPKSFPSPLPTINPTPDATLSALQQARGLSPAGAPVCKDDGVKFAPTVTKALRDGKGNIDVAWTTTDTQEFVVYFGLSGKDLVYNSGRVKGQSTVLHKTNPQAMYDVVVCSVSPCGEEKCSVRFIDP